MLSIFENYKILIYFEEQEKEPNRKNNIMEVLATLKLLCKGKSHALGIILSLEGSMLDFYF
jgi:hypothetical protein